MLYFKSIFFFLTFFSVLTADNSYSQVSNDTAVAQKIAGLTNIWNKYNDLSNFEFTYGDQRSASDFFKHADPSNDSIYSVYLNKLKISSQNAAKDNYGLKAIATYANNFNSPIVPDDNLIYRTRVQTGLDWDVLKDGYYQSKLLAEEKGNEWLIHGLEHKKLLKFNLFADQYAHIIYLFNGEKIKVLKKRKEMDDQKLPIANDLYHMEEIPYAEVVEVNTELTDVNGMYMVYQNYNDMLENKVDKKEIPADPYPFIDIDFPKLASNVFKSTNTSIDDSILNLKIRNLKLEANPINSIAVTANGRYNYYYIDNTLGNRDFFSLGVSVSVPLPLGRKNNNTAINDEKQLLNYEVQSLRDTNTYEEMLSGVYDFRYKLKQYLNFMQKREEFREQLRVEKIKQQFDDTVFNPLKALNLLDNLLQIDLEMLDLHQQMYLQLLKIENKYPGVNIAECIIPFDMSSISPSNSDKKMNTSVYVWSSAFESLSVQQIAEWLVLNKISNAVIAVKKDGSTTPSVAALGDTLFKHGISSEIMLGNNKLMDEDVHSALEAAVAGLDLKHFSAVHLDVEPHTFKDYKGNEDKYLKQYVNMLSEAKKFCNEKGLKLAVSIPVYYPDDVVKQIFSLCDKVYFMAYENVNIDFIMRKTAYAFSLAKNKCVIAIRTEDFSSRAEMDQFMKKVSGVLNTDQFALHDLTRLIKLGK